MTKNQALIFSQAGFYCLTSAKRLTSVRPLRGWPGLGPRKLDQRDQQDARQQQLGAAEGKHGVLAE